MTFRGKIPDTLSVKLFGPTYVNIILIDLNTYLLLDSTEFINECITYLFRSEYARRYIYYLNLIGYFGR